MLKYIILYCTLHTIVLTNINNIDNNIDKKISDKNNYMELLVYGWDTKITDLEGKAINA